MGPKRKATEAAAAASAKKPKVNGTITNFFTKPAASAKKTTTASTTAGDISSDGAPNSITDVHQTSTSTSTWNKDAWVKTLTPQNRALLELEIKTMDVTWLRELKDELVSTHFINLKKFLQSEKDTGQKVYPAEEDIYSWSRHTPLNKLRVVILGQDPYHGPNQAHGLAFSVRPPVPPPPSLKNIFIALKNDYPAGQPNAFRPPPGNKGLLTAWADRGVLLLNTCLTVRASAALSHGNKGWEKFTQKVIDVANKKGGKELPGSDGTGGVVFLAWGASAAARVLSVDSKKHLVLHAAHPSPLSAHRGFFKAEHFKKTNAWLEEKYGDSGTVNWDLGDEETLKAGF